MAPEGFGIHDQIKGLLAAESMVSSPYLRGGNRNSGGRLNRSRRSSHHTPGNYPNNMDCETLISIATQIVEVPPQSRKEGEQLEEQLLAAEPLASENELTARDDLVYALSLFQATDLRVENGLLNKVDLQHRAREVLHELGQHTYCQHS